MEETVIEMLAIIALCCFTLYLLLCFLTLVFFLYDVWRYDLKFIVKEFLFRKLNKK